MTRVLRSVWPAERVLTSQGGLLVVDKPYGIAVQGGGDEEEDVTVRLKRWLMDRGFGDALGVHQRLDVGVSGVMAFASDRARNVLMARDFQRRAVEKTYVAAVSLARPLPNSGTLRHRLLGSKGGPTEVVASGGSEAVTTYEVLERHSSRALVLLRPQTGRTHQLRVQLADVGAPIAGDTLYGGAPAFRLMLHSKELGLPSLGGRFGVAVPSELRGWVRGETLGLGTADEVRRKLADAVCRRNAVHATALRLVNDAADGLPGLAVDAYGDWVVLNLSTPEAQERRREIAERCLELGARGVYVKVRERAKCETGDTEDRAPHEPLVGEAAPEPLTVAEGALSFQVLLGDGLSTGLFVDQRRQRARILGTSQGARVLNLFAYTCSFSVAAALGGARDVVSVDLSRRALERGEANFRANALDPARYRFVKGDVKSWLRRAATKGERFDRIILDPPSFSKSKQGIFRVSDGYTELAASALRLLSVRGTLLAVTNHKKTSRQAFRRQLHEAGRAAGRSIRRIKDLPSAVDCPDLPDGPAPSIAALVELDD